MDSNGYILYANTDNENVSMVSPPPSKITKIFFNGSLGFQCLGEVRRKDVDALELWFFGKK